MDNGQWIYCVHEQRCLSRLQEARWISTRQLILYRFCGSRVGFGDVCLGCVCPWPEPDSIIHHVPQTNEQGRGHTAHRVVWQRCQNVSIEHGKFCFLPTSGGKETILQSLYHSVSRSMNPGVEDEWKMFRHEAYIMARLFTLELG
jgi:hypothetical protein